MYNVNSFTNRLFPFSLDSVCYCLPCAKRNGFKYKSNKRPAARSICSLTYCGQQISTGELLLFTANIV